MTTPHTTDPIHIRPALTTDVPAILQIEQLSFIHTSEQFGSRKINYLIQSPRVITAVAERQGVVMGWAAGHTWIRSPQPWGRVYALAVHPDSRGMKLGPKLLLHLIHALRQRGAGPIFLEVRADNHPAINLYEKYGFTPCATLEHYYARNLTAIRMRLATPHHP